MDEYNIEERIAIIIEGSNLTEKQARKLQAMKMSQDCRKCPKGAGNWCMKCPDLPIIFKNQAM